MHSKLGTNTVTEFAKELDQLSQLRANLTKIHTQKNGLKILITTR